MFLDTAYLVAPINTLDQWHEAAVRWSLRLAENRQPLVTTEYVLIEFADAMAAVRFRSQAFATIGTLRSSASLEIVPASTTLFNDAFALYHRRSDKEWGMTDCASFVVMSERAINIALTTDGHFRQAGFCPLRVEDA